MKYRVKQEGSSFFVQRRILFLWLYVTYDVHWATCRECFKSLVQAKAFIREKMQEECREPMIYHY